MPGKAVMEANNGLRTGGRIDGFYTVIIRAGG